MRLVCPNCDAEYEVDDNVIPTDGRDVQCSSCGQTWFQKSALQLQQAEAPVAAEPVTQPATPQDPVPEDLPEQEEFQAPERRTPDEAVLDVLRQEAARETEARLEDNQGGVETQPDLGLDDTSEPETGSAVNQRTARLRGIEPEISKNSHRSDLLPDIEEINSSLQVESEIELLEADTQKKRGRSGFRLGFSIVLIAATALLLAYIYAPQIIEKLPASEPYMVSYVETVNSLRVWLDEMMKTATDKMSNSAAES